jgi:hypothetical protein
MSKTLEVDIFLGEGHRDGDNAAAKNVKKARK